MKKMIVFGLIMLSIIISSPRGFCSKIGVENAWELSSQTNFSLFTGVYTEDYSAYQPVANGRLVYKWNKFTRDMELILEFEKCNKVYEEFYAGYTMPLVSAWDMNAGVIFGVEGGKAKEYVQIRSRGSYKYGDIILENKFGSNEEMLSIMYTCEKQIAFLNDMLIKGELGLSYQWDNLTGAELVVPVKVFGVSKLFNSVSLLVEASNEYSFCTGDFADTRFSLCLRMDWNIETPDILETVIPVEENPQIIVLLKDDDEEQTNKEPFIPLNEVDVDKEDCLPNEVSTNPDVVNPEQFLDNKEISVESRLDVSNKQESLKQPAIDYDVQTETFCYKGNEIYVRSYVNEGEVFLQIRQIILSLGGRVFWDEDVKQIYIIQDVQKIMIDVESLYFMVGGYYYVIDKCIYLDGHYYLEVDEFKRLMSEERAGGLLAKPYNSSK